MSVCMSVCTWAYICSHQSPTWVEQRVGACFFLCALYYPAAHVHTAEQVRLVYVRLPACAYAWQRDRLHAPISEVTPMSGHPPADVNRLWPLHRPCNLTLIFVNRLLSASAANVKSLMSGKEISPWSRGCLTPHQTFWWEKYIWRNSTQAWFSSSSELQNLVL